MADKLVEKDGSPASKDFRELRTKQGWTDQEADEKRLSKEYAMSADGAGGRSIGEHAKAVFRAVMEPKEFREVYESGGKRDRANSLYDRKKVKD